jgi:predicted enzyme related to lactoylglutathione lyase
MTTTPTTVTGIDASYYLAKDLARATAFYKDVMGLIPTMEVPGCVSEFTFPNGETFGLYKPQDGSWHQGSGVMFAVADCRAKVDELKARGVKFEDDGKLEDTPVCYMAFGEDSEGNNFIVHQRKT